MFLENSIWNLVARKVRKILTDGSEIANLQFQKKIYKCVCCVSGFRICKMIIQTDGFTLSCSNISLY